MAADEIYDRRFEPFALDLEKRKILREGRVVTRSRRRFEILKALLDAGGAVVTIPNLIDRAFDGNYELEPHTVVKTVNDLKRDLGDFEDCIQNDYGVGYYFRPPATADVIPKGIDLDTWTLYRIGLDEWNRRTEGSLQRGLQHFRQVILNCPNFTPGYIGAAECLSLLAHVGFQVFRPSDVVAEAKACAKKALDTAGDKETLAAAHSAMGKIHFLFDWSLKRAEQEFGAARELHPACAPAHQGLAHVYLVTGRWTESLESINCARRAAPSSPIIHASVGWFLLFMGRHAEAARAFEQTTELHPDFPAGFFMRGVAQEALGMFEEAVVAFSRSYELSPSPAPLSAMGHAYAKSGKRAKARSVLGEMSKLARKRLVSSYFFALVHAGLGENNTALACLERARDERCDWLLYAGLDPRWDVLHNEPSFRQLLKRVGVLQYWALR